MNPENTLEAAGDQLIEAIGKGDLAAIDAAVAGFPPSAFAADEPIGWAVLSGQAASLEHLIKLGFSITDESAHWHPLSNLAMHEAAEKGRIDLLEIMISRGDGRAFINSFAHPCDWTPLMAAINANHPQVVRYLIDAGADVNADDPTKIITSAVQQAVEDQRPELVAMLLAAGANPDVPGWMWISARDKAQESTPEIRAMIDAVPFRSVDHPRYVRDGLWPPPGKGGHADDARAT